MNLPSEIPLKTPSCATGPSTCGAGTCGVTDRTVCHCFAVKESTLRQLIDHQGVTAVEDLVGHTPAGSGCRGCQCRLQRMVEGLPAVCSGRFDLCGQCGCIGAICRCEAAA